MKPLSILKSAAFQLALLATFMALPACSWFNKNVKPALSCAGKNVSMEDYSRAKADLESVPPNYVDLAILCGTVGWDIGTCIIDDIKTKNVQLAPKAAEFQRQHAVEIRNAQPVSLRSPGDSTPKTGPTVSGIIDVSSWSVSNAIPIYSGSTSDLMQTNYIPAIGCLSGTTLRERFGDWECVPPASALTGDITIESSPLLISDPIRLALDLAWFSSPGWMRVRGGALVKWSAGHWDVVSLQPSGNLAATL